MEQAAKSDLLRFAISFIENRIQIVDNKASILLAIQAGFFGIMTWTVEKLFLSHGILLIPSYILVIVTAVFAVIIIGFLLQTIRPSRRYLCLYASLVELDGKKGIIWGRSKAILDDKEFLQRVSELSDDEIELEYKSTLFAVQQLVDRKYASYRREVLTAKLEMLVLFTSLIGLIVARIANQ